MGRALSLSLALIVASSAIAPPLAAKSAGKPVYGAWGLDLTAMDKSIKPGDDFYDYALGSWLKRTAIAPDKTGAGYNYDLPDLAERDVRAIAERAAQHRDDPIQRQIADYYSAYMDTAGIEARGLSPAKPYLTRIDALNDRHQLVALMFEPGYPSAIGLGPTPDAKDPTHYTVAANQGGLGLPAREYYLSPEAKYAGFRTAYTGYIAKLLSLAGYADAPARAARILALETAIARAHWTPEQNRDPVKTYNPMNRAQLTRLAPEFDWDATLRQLGLGKMPTVVIGQPSAITATGALVAATPLQTWKDYMAFHFLSSHAAYLPKAFDDARFAFYSKTLRGVPEQRARWKRAVGELDGNLGEAVGQIYVRDHWPAETERQMGELLADLKAAYQDKIEHAAWLDAATRKAALVKLSTFDPRVGHPAKYIDYASMTVSPSDPLANSLASEVFQWKLALSRLDKPVDRGLWYMTPQTVNAYYDPTMNQITFPAAILQPPFFDPAADPAVNYGMTGATIGHEMGHGFDDEGRQFDEKGRLRDWWTKAVADKYNAQAQRLVKQFDQYEPIPGVHIKGQLTLGENLGDLGGLEAAYAAWRRYVARHGEPRRVDGFTGDQRFFLAYAASWQGKQREESLRSQLLSNPHSPDKYRVNGIVRNMDEWYKAFDVKPGDKMYLAPKDRVRVW